MRFIHIAQGTHAVEAQQPDFPLGDLESLAASLAWEDRVLVCGDLFTLAIWMDTCIKTFCGPYYARLTMSGSGSHAASTG